MLTLSIMKGGDLLATSTLVGEPIATKPPVRPTEGEVVQAICEEAGCSAEAAKGLVGMLHDTVERLRSWKKDGEPGQLFWHLSQSDLDRHHALLEVVMPDDAVNPRAGSAHELIHGLLLERDEFALVHTKRGKRVVFCAVGLALRIV